MSPLARCRPTGRPSACLPAEAVPARVTPGPACCPRPLPQNDYQEVSTAGPYLYSPVGCSGFCPERTPDSRTTQLTRRGGLSEARPPPAAWLPHAADDECLAHREQEPEDQGSQAE